MLSKFFLKFKHFLLYFMRKILNKNNHEIFNYSRVISIDDIYDNLNLNNPCIFDVGAHEGESIARFQKIFEKSFIYSFEPQKDQYDTIKNNKFSNSKIFNLALSNRVGTQEFFVTTKTSNSSLVDININSEKTKNASMKRGLKPEELVKKNFNEY